MMESRLRENTALAPAASGARANRDTIARPAHDHDMAPSTSPRPCKGRKAVPHMCMYMRTAMAAAAPAGSAGAQRVGALGHFSTPAAHELLILKLRASDDERTEQVCGDGTHSQ